MDKNSLDSRLEELRQQAEKLLENSGRDKSAEFSHVDILHLIYELEVHQAELRIQNEELRLTQQELERSRREYSDLYDFAPAGYVIVNRKGVVVKANRAALDLLGRSKDKIMGRGFSQFIYHKDRNAYFDLIQEIAPGRKRAGEIRLLRGNDPFCARVEITPSVSDDAHFSGWRIVFADISDRKRAEEELRKKSLYLEESNAALRALLREREHDRKELEETIRNNVGMLIDPYLDRLKKSKLNENQRIQLDILETHFHQITSPFTRKLAVIDLRLTPTETRVAALVKEGKSTKEISEVLGIAERSVAVHREHIRAKLGLRGKRSNLRSHLLSLS